jgi:hypothetical protein
MSTSIEIRPSRPDDSAALRDLAALDSAAPLTGDVLVAVVEDTAVAALSIDDGRVIADPFRRTADTVAMLELRAAGHGRRARTTRARVPLLAKLGLAA